MLSTQECAGCNPGPPARPAWDAIITAASWHYILVGETTLRLQPKMGVLGCGESQYMKRGYQNGGQHEEIMSRGQQEVHKRRLIKSLTVRALQGSIELLLLPASPCRENEITQYPIPRPPRYRWRWIASEPPQRLRPFCGRWACSLDIVLCWRYTTFRHSIPSPSSPGQNWLRRRIGMRRITTGSSLGGMDAGSRRCISDMVGCSGCQEAKG